MERKPRIDQFLEGLKTVTRKVDPSVLFELFRDSGCECFGMFGVREHSGIIDMLSRANKRGLGRRI